MCLTRHSLLLMVLATLVLSAPVSAHVQIQGSALDVGVYRDRITLTAHVVRDEIPIDESQPGTPEVEQRELESYGRYLSGNLHVRVDGEELTGRLVRAVRPADASKRGECELEFRSGATPPRLLLPDGATLPVGLQIRSTLMEGRPDLVAADVAGIVYAVRISLEGQLGQEGLLLTDEDPLYVEFLPPRAGATASAAGPVSTESSGVFGPYVKHGVHHILSGYDHLLFVTALVLAATSLWDLVKVVSVFTLAHTITLCLSAFDVVRLPSSVVEPFIAGSIVFIAVQNVFWPQRSRGAVRLAAAFFFGLFHGLGFAGGLLDAMQGMSGGVAVLAIAAFSLGVELGHQVVVLPLYAALSAGRAWKARRARQHPTGRRSFALRYGSAGIAVAGVFYLAQSLHLIHVLAE